MPDGERRCGDCFAYMHGFGASILSKCGVVDIRAVYTAVFHYVYGGRFGLNIKCRQVRQAQVCFDRDRNRSANVGIQDNLRVIERDLSRYRFGQIMKGIGMRLLQNAPMLIVSLAVILLPVIISTRSSKSAQ